MIKQHQNTIFGTNFMQNTHCSWLEGYTIVISPRLKFYSKALTFLIRDNIQINIALLLMGTYETD